MPALREYLGSMSKPAHIAADVAAFGAIVGSWFEYLPLVAAGLAAVWYGVQIWESKTARKLTGRNDS